MIRSIQRVIAPVRWGGLATVVVLSVVVLLGALAIIQGYENRLATINRNLEHLVAKRTKTLMKTRNAVIFGLAKLAESRDTDTGEHLDRIRIFSMLLARQLAKSNPTSERWVFPITFC